MAVVPGRLPLCHQLPLPLFLTFQPLAYFTSADEGFARLGVVMLADRILAQETAAISGPANVVREGGRGRAALASQPPWESIRVTFIPYGILPICP